MPKFFVPAANDDDQAESVRAGVIKFMVEQGYQDITSKRIFKLAYRHDSQDYEAEVGQPDTLAGDSVVAMILPDARTNIDDPDRNDRVHS